MELSAIGAYAAGGNLSKAIFGVGSPTAATSLTGTLLDKEDSADGTLFEAILNSAIENVETTNNLVKDRDAESIKFALGESETTHDLTVAASKASTALSYTVALRDKFLEAYREIMQIQI
jgi:flagellar hook-basal body complex protein FliE